jgi:secreted PhoX family phosphatase
MAGSAVNATTMDRPEWIAVNPTAPEAYCCLTNNSRRGADQRRRHGADQCRRRADDGQRAQPARVNRYGQIVRWRPAGGDHGATSFEWDLYVMAGNPTVHDDVYAGSPNINAGNLFNSPDGMQIDTTGLIWIQTDGNDEQRGRLRGHGQQPDARGRPGHRRDPPLPDRAERLRGHRYDLVLGPPHDVRGHPAPGRRWR